MNRYLCIHAHFYQPPRENPWLESIELQDSAYPYHDWNERIMAECYAPNSSARILDAEQHIRRIVNNYESTSFNFGPTLLSWLGADSPGLEDLWQLHWSYNGMLEHNAPGRFIANVEDAATVAGLIANPPTPVGGVAPSPAGRGGPGGVGRGNAAVAHTPAYWIKVSAQQDGTFTVTNARNGFGIRTTGTWNAR